MIDKIAAIPDGLYALAEPLSWVLLHFLWQGALGAALLASALYLLRNHSSRVRYAVSLTTLVGLLMLPAVTWWTLPTAPESGDVAVAEMQAVPVVPTMIAPEAAITSEPASNGASWTNPVGNQWASIAPWVVSLWVVGVLVSSARMLGSWFYTRRLRHQAQPLSNSWRRRIDALAERVGVQRSVEALQSSRVEVPMVAGWWRPVILMPVGFLTGMAPAQVEAIVAHELAHIRRHDVLVGWIQAVAETLLFYHPAVWWVSRQVRIEREHCCDDVAVAVSASRATYARALTKLEERRQPRPALVLAANDGSLLGRIRRLIERPAPQPAYERMTGAVASLLLAGGLLITSACATAQSSADAPSTTPAAADQTIRAAPGDTNEVAVSRRMYVVRDSTGSATVKIWTDSTDGRRPHVWSERWGALAWGASDSRKAGTRILTINGDTLIWRPDEVPAPPGAPHPPKAFRFDIEGQAPRAFLFRGDSLHRPPHPPKAFRFDRDGRAPRVFMFEGDSLRVPSPPPIPDVYHFELDSLRRPGNGMVHLFRADSLFDINTDSLRHQLESSARIYMREMMENEKEWKERREKLRREMEEYRRELRRQMEDREHELEAFRYEFEHELKRELPEHLREQAEALRRQAEQLEEQAREMETRRDTSGTRER